MLNISVLPPAKSSPDNLIAISSSGNSDTQQSSVERFAKALEREISESTSQFEVSNSSAKSSKETISSEEKVITQAEIKDTLDIHEPTKDCLIETAVPYQDSLLPFQLELIPGQNALMTISILPEDLSVPDHIPSISQDSKFTANSNLVLSHIMQQQRLAQAAIAANDSFYSADNLWQASHIADFAARDNFLSFSSETSEAVQINTPSPIFLGFNESTPPFIGLAPPTSAITLNTIPQHVQVDLLVGQPKWSDEFAQKIVWLTTQQHQVAEIHLNPVHLGPVEVILNITQDQATAQFLSPHAEVLGIIEEALPKLREMMAENGIQLGNVMVGSDSSRQENKQQQANTLIKHTSNMKDSRTEITSPIRTNALLHRHDGIINTYA